MKKFPSIISIALMSLLLSCSKDNGALMSDLPVVESYLQPGSVVTVKISRKTPTDATSTLPAIDLDHLEVGLFYAGIRYPLVPMGEGVYSDTIGLIQVRPDSSYYLQFTWEESLVSSSTIIPSKPSGESQSDTSISMYQWDPDDPPAGQHPDPVTISFTNDDDSYYLATIECMESDPVPVFKDTTYVNDLFSSRPTTDDFININPMSIRYFGRNRIILYHINPEYSAFFMRQMSTSQNYQEPPTNIVNGLGIFTGINPDTLYLNVIRKTK
jgi:hypothetical protein